VAVDDHGLEALKKAAEEVTPGNKSNYYIKVGNTVGGTAISNANPLPVKQQTYATATNTRPTVTTTTSVILASNTSRKSAVIFNQSGAVVYLKYTDAAVVGQGIRLPNDEKHIIDSTNLFTGAIQAIRNAGSGAVDVMEGT